MDRSAYGKTAPHDGLRDPHAPGRPFTPNEKYAALVEAAGYVPVALSASDYIELLPATWRAINAYGVRINHRTYDAPELNPLRRQPSGITAKHEPVGGPPRPLRRLQGLDPRPGGDRLDYPGLEAPATGSDSLRGAGLGPRAGQHAHQQW